jgi:hypothetical protein
VKDLTGEDISSDRPRDVREMSLGHFDLIVVLDRTVARALLVPSGSTVLVWDVSDPTASRSPSTGGARKIFETASHGCFLEPRWCS